MRHSHRDTSEGPDRRSTSRTPRWVKVCGIVALVLVLMVVALVLAGGGRHGPGRHTASGADAAARTPPAGFTEDGTAAGGDPGGPRTPAGRQP